MRGPLEHSHRDFVANQCFMIFMVYLKVLLDRSFSSFDFLVLLLEFSRWQHWTRNMGVTKHNMVLPTEKQRDDEPYAWIRPNVWRYGRSWDLSETLKSSPSRQRNPNLFGCRPTNIEYLVDALRLERKPACSVLHANWWIGWLFATEITSITPGLLYPVSRMSWRSFRAFQWS